MPTGLWGNLSAIRDSSQKRTAEILAADGAGERTRHYVRDLEERFDKLALICMAMWSLMQQTTNLTEEDLMERVKQIDLVDGEADGRITPQLARCSQCNRVMSPRHIRCLYCGTEKIRVTAFDALT